MLGQTAATPGAAPPTSLRLVEEINHRVLNQYCEAIATLSLAASGTGDDDARGVLVQAADRLRDHAESHRALLPPRADDQANLAPYIGQVCRAFSRAALADRKVELVLKTCDVMMPADDCWRLGLVVAELVRNAARHGLRGTGGEIGVHISRQATLVHCLVRDNGRPPVRPVPGRGQDLIRSLVADLGGVVEWCFTPDGAAALVQVPLRGSQVLGDNGDGRLK